MVFQMPPHVAGQPIGVRDQEVEAELIVWQPNGEEASVDHGDALEGCLGLSVGHVLIVQDADNWQAPPIVAGLPLFGCRMRCVGPLS